jgi:adenine-specific DNA-methyltransferase
VVDLERDQLEPLPNLTYKLRVGNSLLETIEGEPILPDLPPGEVPIAPFQGVMEGTGKGVQIGFDMDTDTARARTRLSEHKEQYFAATDKAEKERLRHRIENEERQVVLNALKVKREAVRLQIEGITKKGVLVNWKGMAREQREVGKLSLRLGSIQDVYTAVEKGEPLPFFLYRLHFFEVFRERGGFDIVLANPPYVRQEEIKAQKPALKIAYPEVYHGVADLYVYFYARALNLLRDGGLLTFISSNKFMRSNYGQGLRRYLASVATILSVIDFGDTPIFEATTYPAIVVARKQIANSTHQPYALNVRDMETVGQLTTAVRERAFIIDSTALTADAWTLEDIRVITLVRRLNENALSLEKLVKGNFYRGITTGYNNAFVIDKSLRDALIAADSKNAEVIKIYYRGRDIKRWYNDWANLYLLYIPWDFELDKYPAIAEHLSIYFEQLSIRPEVLNGRFPWFALSRYASNYYWAFLENKIVYPHFNDHVQFSYDDSHALLNNKAYIIPTNDKSILGLLNSKVIEFFIHKVAPPPLQRAYYEYSTYVIGQIPIPNMSNERISIERLVEQLLEVRGMGAGVADLEGELNERVYRLFGLSREEIKIIEGKE